MINLKVEEYCHGCRDFESDTHYDYAGEINNISIFCKHRSKCANLKRYIDRKTTVKTDQVMSKVDLCVRCQYGPNGTGCHLLIDERYTDDICKDCHMSDDGRCKCISIDKYSKACPHYKEVERSE